VFNFAQTAPRDLVNNCGLIGWELATREVSAMPTGFSTFENAVFAPDVTRVMGEAFDRACHALNGGQIPPILKEVMASRVIEEAVAGERDPDRLYRVALKGARAYRPRVRAARRTIARSLHQATVNRDSAEVADSGRPRREPDALNPPQLAASSGGIGSRLSTGLQVARTDHEQHPSVR
jgi:hypothetical protein